MTTILICEKPDAAKKIAYALTEGKVKHIRSKSGIVYFLFQRNGKDHLAVPAVGHIFTLKDVAGKGWIYPVFKLAWVPTFEANKKSEFIRRYYNAFVEATGAADEFIIATDKDEEGSVIGYNILRFICKKEKGKRMNFSTLTKQDLLESYKNLSPKLDFGRIESGLTRHELDFLYGINISRALTLAIKHGGKRLKHHILSAGRVQTPMLYFLIKREKEIQKFKSKPYWMLEAEMATNPTLIAVHKDDKFWDKKKVEDIFKKCNNKEATVDKIQKRKTQKLPPHPFDLTSLQTEAYRFFGFSPKMTVDIAQQLYTAGFISYPRTSSQKLPQQIGYRKILEQLSKIGAYTKLCKKLLSIKDLKPNEGKKQDAAHPAVYPTSEPPIITGLKPEGMKLYNLIVRRFMATFAEPAVRESTSVIVNINNEDFKATGSRTIEKNWMEFYGPYAKLEEVEFPDLTKGEKYKVNRLDIISKETQPPSRYSQGSIVKELEKHNLGTKTTRASILQTLYNRTYIEGKSIQVTSLGMRVGETLAKFVPELVSEELTRNFEKDTEQVATGKLTKTKVVKKAEEILTNISKEFKTHEIKIGQALEEVVIGARDKKQILGPCPNCGSNLRIMFSPKTKKRFCGCSGYPDCKTAFPIPLQGLLAANGKVCEKCNTPTIKVVRRGKRPFNMCLDPKCPTKEGWGKKKEKVKE